MYGRPPLGKELLLLLRAVWSGHVSGLLTRLDGRWPRWVTRIGLQAWPRAVMRLTKAEYSNPGPDLLPSQRSAPYVVGLGRGLALRPAGALPKGGGSEDPIMWLSASLRHRCFLVRSYGAVSSSRPASPKAARAAAVPAGRRPPAQPARQRP